MDMDQETEMDQETDVEQSQQVLWNPTTWTPETRTVVLAICTTICLVIKVALADREGNHARVVDDSPDW